MDRLALRIGKPYETALTAGQNQLDTIDEAANMIRGNAESQALGVPKVMTALVSGPGSGVRITQPELTAIARARGIAGDVEGPINSLALDAPELSSVCVSYDVSTVELSTLVSTLVSLPMLLTSAKDVAMGYSVSNFCLASVLVLPYLARNFSALKQTRSQRMSKLIWANTRRIQQHWRRRSVSSVPGESSASVSGIARRLVASARYTPLGPLLRQPHNFNV